MRDNLSDAQIKAYEHVLSVIISYYRKETSLRFDDTADTGFYDFSTDSITIPPSLIRTFYQNYLPLFPVIYHEIGHALYSDTLFKLTVYWKKLGKTQAPANKLYNDAYHYLLNWIEDYYIEDKIVNEYYYLTDIMHCLKELPPSYDETKPEYSFHNYYNYGDSASSLSPADNQQFISLISDCLLKRKRINTMPVSFVIINENSIFIDSILALFDFCVKHNIVDPLQPPPPLPNPMYVPQGQGQGQGQSGQGQSGQNGQQGPGTSSAHSGQVGKVVAGLPKFDPQVTVNLFKDELNIEDRLVNNYLNDCIDMHTNKDTLDGLFSLDYHNSTTIGKPNIKNFFNDRKIETRDLFLNKNKSFNNVSIYRDVSGSTSGIFSLFDKITKFIIDKIPIDYHYYLYASGDVSILEINYIPYLDKHNAPDEYQNNPLFNQLGSGTNSDAIADVITKQLSDRWLNIILTDGDLNSLCQRNNIKGLLKNVAVVVIGNSGLTFDDIPKEHIVYVESEKDIDNVVGMLLTFRRI